MKLYELTENYNQLLSYLEDEEVEDSIVEDTLKSIEEPLQEKTENIIKLIRHLEGNELVLKKEIDRLAKKRQSNKRNIDSLKNYLTDSLDTLQDPRVKTPLFSVWVQNNPPSVEIIREEEVPAAYFEEQAPKLDRRKLLDDLRAGEEVTGAVLTQSRGVRFR